MADKLSCQMLFRRPYGLAPKKIYGMNCPGTKVMSLKNKQNSSANFLVRAKFFTERPPLVITIPHRLYGWGVKMSQTSLPQFFYQSVFLC